MCRDQKENKKLIFNPETDRQRATDSSATEMSHRSSKAAITTVERHTYTRDQWAQQMAQQHVTREDMNRLVMDFLVVEGYMEVARQFSLESGTERESFSSFLLSRLALSSVAEPREKRRSTSTTSPRG